MNRDSLDTLISVASFFKSQLALSFTFCWWAQVPFSFVPPDTEIFKRERKSQGLHGGGEIGIFPSPRA